MIQLLNVSKIFTRNSFAKTLLLVAIFFSTSACMSLYVGGIYNHPNAEMIRDIPHGATFIVADFQNRNAKDFFPAFVRHLQKNGIFIDIADEERMLITTQNYVMANSRVSQKMEIKIRDTYEGVKVVICTFVRVESRTLYPRLQTSRVASFGANPASDAFIFSAYLIKDFGGARLQYETIDPLYFLETGDFSHPRFTRPRSQQTTSDVE
jgi:hypothetical protein